MGVPRAQLPSGTRFIAGGIAEVLMAWIEHPQGITAEQLSNNLRLYALALTKTLKKIG